MRVKRICIIGGSGTGKTTLANNLGTQLKIAVYHIDAIHHLANWNIRDKAERDAIIADIVHKREWIIDGTYRSTLKMRLEQADYVIYLDYSTVAQIKGVLKRFLCYHGQERAELPGCKERMTSEFFWSVVKWRKNKRPFIIQSLSEIDQDKVHIFKNRHQLNQWYQKQFHEKIKF